LSSLWNPPIKQLEVESNTPFVPPPPKVPAVSAASDGISVPASAEGSKDGAKKKEKKQRYLDSLMEKAGELSLKCASGTAWNVWLMAGSILDSEGNWTAEEGKYKKSEICRDHDLSVSRASFILATTDA